MAKFTYYIAREQRIQSRPFKVGEIVGEGDVESGEFRPAPGLEKYVELGHVLARLPDGRITTKNPLASGGEAKARDEAKASPLKTAKSKA